MKVLFNYVSTRTKFFVTWPLALAGAVTTWVFIADLTGLDLLEQVWFFPLVCRCEHA